MCGFRPLLPGRLHAIAPTAAPSLGLLLICQTGISFFYHYGNSVHFTLVFWVLCFQYCMSFSFLDSFFAFVEHISSESLRKHLGGKSLEVAQVCKVSLPLHVGGLARPRLTIIFLRPLCRLSSILFLCSSWRMEFDGILITASCQWLFFFWRFLESAVYLRLYEIWWYALQCGSCDYQNPPKSMVLFNSIELKLKRGWQMRNLHFAAFVTLDGPYD